MPLTYVMFKYTDLYNFDIEIAKNTVYEISNYTDFKTINYLPSHILMLEITCDHKIDMLPYTIIYIGINSLKYRWDKLPPNLQILEIRSFTNDIYNIPFLINCIYPQIFYKITNFNKMNSIYNINSDIYRLKYISTILKKCKLLIFDRTNITNMNNILNFKIGNINMYEYSNSEYYRYLEYICCYTEV